MKYNVERRPPTQPTDQTIKLIPLTKNMNAIVDAKHYDRLMEAHWFPQKSKRGDTYYAVRKEVLPSGKIRKIYMHREVTGGVNKRYDHKNGNGLDNREDNLRPCNQSQNGANRPKQKRKSGFKGVYRQNNFPNHPYARISINGCDTVLGTFATEEEAARAYDNAAVAAWGEFARTNFPRCDSIKPHGSE